MDALCGSSSKAATCFCYPSKNFSSIWRNGHLSFVPIWSEKLVRSIKVEAKKGNGKKNKNAKSDSHSFAPKPDEATGPFPEALLLKEKKVQEDGRVLPEFADAEEEELFEFINLQLESDLDVKEMRHYEVVYLIHQDHKDHVEAVNSKVQEFIEEKKGRVWRFSDWGMRRLCYKINKATHAHYILMNFQIRGQWINDFKTMLDKDERVIRHLVMKRDKAITEECPPPPEFHTLRADMVDEYEVDDMDDDWDDDEEIDLEGYEDDDGDMEEDVSSNNGQEDIKTNQKRNKVLT